MSKSHNHFEEARDPKFWRRLNPGLKVTEAQKLLSTRGVQIKPSEIEAAKASLIKDGYFHIEQLLDMDVVHRLTLGVEVIWQAGWPSPFAVIYDEYWELFHSLRQLFSAILGSEYKQVPNFWCWYIDTTDNSKGWGHHRDRPSVNTVLENGMPATLTVWIPLTDATALNGCIYVLPAGLDPNYPQNLESREVINLQNVRALTAEQGSVLGWTEALLHWGSRSSARAKAPRISISFTYQKGDLQPYETPLFDPQQLPSFQDRLGLIAQNVVRFQGHGAAPAKIVDACIRLSNLIPTIEVQDGYERQILEVDRRLSESMLWKLEEESYELQGLNLKSKPMVLLSNSTLLCETFAEMVLTFLLDCSCEINHDSPLYILELAGESGCFAYRFFNELLEKITDFDSLQPLNIKYILSAMTPNVVNKWLDNERLAKLKASNILDFAIFNPEKDSVLKLINSGQIINKSQINNPLVVIANCVFSKMVHDAFRVVSEVLQETRVTVFRDARDSNLDNPIHLANLRTSERYFDIEKSSSGISYYKKPNLDTILEYYRTKFEQASIIFPIGALRTIANLKELANSKLALFVADKGFASLNSSQIRGLWQHKLVSDGSCSAAINFDAIARYCSEQGGISLMEASDSNGLGIALNTTFKHPHTNSAHYFRQGIAKRDPINSLNNIQELFSKTSMKIAHDLQKLPVFLSTVRTYNFDPAVFTLMFDMVSDTMSDEVAKLDKSDKKVSEDLLTLLKRTTKNLYAGQTTDRDIDCLLRFYVSLKQFDECLELCQELLQEFGPIGTVLDHAAICCESTGQFALAYEYFEKSLTLTPSHQWAQEGLERLKLWNY